jgi:hypothetical protein
MTVGSGQMPYQYGIKLPIRAPVGGWPGLARPNIGPSGNVMEAAMFVLHAEMRKWGNDLLIVPYSVHVHPDIAASGFEPKAGGETLAGLVGPTAADIVVDHIETMRVNLFELFDSYAIDLNFNEEEVLEAWLTSAYPESPSGHIRVIGFGFSNAGQTFLRPPLEDVTGGNFITTLDTHWLGGSGVLFDIDAGEVTFNPFPFPRRFVNATIDGQYTLFFSPIYPYIQTTAGNLPTVIPARYESINQFNQYRVNTNFNAIASGYVQIDGYCLIPETTIELVYGNDFNFYDTVSDVSDYTGHIQGLRAVGNTIGENDPSARIYRLPSAQSSGLYRLLTHNRRVDVPDTAIPSGFISLFPPGRVIKNNLGDLVLVNQIDGQQYTITSDGGLDIESGSAKGIHVFDDTIWITSPYLQGSGDLSTRGLYPISPFTGELIWYRPAELTLSTSGNVGPGPGAFGSHNGLFQIGTDFVRLSKTYTAFSVVTSPTTTGTYQLHWQLYDETTLGHQEVSKWFEVVTTTGGTPQPIFDDLAGVLFDGTNIYTYREFGQIAAFDTNFDFVENYFTGNIARRRHYANGQLLYTRGGNVTVGDPLSSMSPPGGSSSGIGVWSISAPNYTHDSAKRLRAETFFGHRVSAIIHSIFDVSGATHIANGVWMLIQFRSGLGGVQDTELFLCRIIESADEWTVVQAFRLSQSIQTTGDGDTEFPVEGILHEID